MSHRFFTTTLILLTVCLSACPGKKPPRKHVQSQQSVHQKHNDSPEAMAASQLTQQALIAFKEKDLNRAEDKLAEAIRLSPTFGAAYYWLARVKYELNHLDKALHLLDRAEILLQQSKQWIHRIDLLKTYIKEAQNS